MKSRLVLFEFHQLGDALLSFPFLRAAMAEHEVWVCCRPEQVPVFSWLLPAERIVAWEPGSRFPGWTSPLGAKKAAGWDAIRGADVGVCAWADPRPQKLMRDLGIKERVGLPITPANYFTDAAALETPKLRATKLVEAWYQITRGPLLTHPVHRSDRFAPHLESWHRIGDTLRMTPQYATPWFDVQDLKSHVSPEIAETAAAFRSGPGPRWALHPGARLACRRWARANWEELIARGFGHGSGRKTGHATVPLFIEPPGETWDVPDARIVQCKSIDDLAFVLDACTHLLAHDSFPAHVGAALGKRVVSLFGEMPACWFAPFDNAPGVVGGELMHVTESRGPQRAWPLHRDLDAKRRSLADKIPVEEVVEACCRVEAL